MAVRKARVELRSVRCTIRPPAGMRLRYDAIETGLVEVREIDASEGLFAHQWTALYRVSGAPSGDSAAWGSSKLFHDRE